MVRVKDKALDKALKILIEDKDKSRLTYTILQYYGSIEQFCRDADFCEERVRAYLLDPTDVHEEAKYYNKLVEAAWVNSSETRFFETVFIKDAENESENLNGKRLRKLMRYRFNTIAEFALNTIDYTNPKKPVLRCSTLFITTLLAMSSKELFALFIHNHKRKMRNRIIYFLHRLGVINKDNLETLIEDFKTMPCGWQKVKRKFPYEIKKIL